MYNSTASCGVPVSKCKDRRVSGSISLKIVALVLRLSLSVNWEAVASRESRTISALSSSFFIDIFIFETIQTSFVFSTNKRLVNRNESKACSKLAPLY